MTYKSHDGSASHPADEAELDRIEAEVNAELACTPRITMTDELYAEEFELINAAEREWCRAPQREVWQEITEVASGEPSTES